MIWTWTRSISMMKVRVKWNTSRQASARAVPMMKIRLLDSRALCVSGLDWKNQVHRTTPRRTKKKK